jgi:hypothetical protein
VWGSTRADSKPGSAKTVSAATSDRHNPRLNVVLERLDLHHVWMRIIPAETGRSEAETEVYFDLSDAPYSGPLVLFSVRAGGGQLKGTVKGLTLPMVRVEKGRTVGLELDASDPAVFTPDDPSAVPSSVASGD